jgi:murein DD-endopeptidase MepM/ murein hydrolase activator NlpD
MIVPDHGAGTTRQIRIDLGTVRLVVGGVATAFLLLLGLAGVQAATLSRVLAYDTLVADNELLRGRLQRVDAQLDELSDLVQRVRVYDDKLKDLSKKSALPGFGPLDPDAMAARQAWLDGVVPEVPHADDEADPLAASERIGSRSDALASELAALEPELPHLGENLARIEAVEDTLPVMWPVDDAVLTSPFGYRIQPFTRQWSFHGGVDLGVPFGTPIYATNDGIVSFAGWDNGHGNMVEIDHGGGVTTRYCHASRLLVTEGEPVTAGEVIALVGSTGMSTGPHLHYEILFDGDKADPLAYLP